MKLLCLIHRLTYSGAPKIMSWLASQFADHGHKVKLVSFFGNEQLQTISSNVEIEQLGYTLSKLWPVRFFVQSKKINKKIDEIIDSYKPDIVLTFLDFVGLKFIEKNSQKKRDYLIVASERVDPFTRHGLSARIKKKIIEKADALVFQTEQAKQFYSCNGTTTVIPNPSFFNTNTKIEQYTDDRQNVITSVGRINIKQKGFDILIKAFSIIHRQYPDYILNIYGDGPDMKKLCGYITEYGLENFAFLRGKTNDVPAVLNKSKLFILSSNYEGIPNTLLEALSIGVPSIATDCSPGGARVLIQDGVNGFIVPRGDYNELAAKAIDLIGNPQLRVAFSNNSLKSVKQFEEETIFNKWNLFFLSLLK